MGPESTTPGDGVADGQTSELAAPFFYHISPDPLPYGWEPSGIYQRADHGILGDQDDTTESATIETLQDNSQCFNCGNPEHKVPDCPFRPDRDLIALSRQYYQFFQGTLGLAKFQRIHAVEASRQERLNWLEEFEPGKIQGALLKEALESSNEEWLRNISVWGYPSGWISENHPRERIRYLIWEENNGDIADDLDGDSFFEIHGDGHAVETVSFQGAFQAITHSSVDAGSATPGAIPSHTVSDTSSLSSKTSSHDSEAVECEPPQPPQLVRWANYPPSYFSSHHLIPYIPPRRNTESWSSTSFADTEAYIYQFHSRPPPPPDEEPPPLPPSMAPPPLPTTHVLPSSPPPPQQGIHSHPGFPTHGQSPISQSSQIDPSDSDMELSDSE
ncbi:hypothetical protein M413DRAFT_83920 [Hebeloma cylindrosporum]|uniref:CCHC-type domain-containing protein n=1 Tax=Hebeloma cylindrosporum TaxID=76867 RepID=A0A0C3CX14_HEBCY|nr:hypothetical protein M413DRAFT_83920 [Hebeloma cylindrosporum h7]